MDEWAADLLAYTENVANVVNVAADFFRYGHYAAEYVIWHRERIADSASCGNCDDGLVT